MNLQLRTDLRWVIKRTRKCAQVHAARKLLQKEISMRAL